MQTLSELVDYTQLDNAVKAELEAAGIPIHTKERRWNHAMAPEMYGTIKSIYQGAFFFTRNGSDRQWAVTFERQERGWVSDVWPEGLYELLDGQPHPGYLLHARSGTLLVSSAEGLKRAAEIIAPFVAAIK